MPARSTLRGAGQQSGRRTYATSRSGGTSTVRWVTGFGLRFPSSLQTTGPVNRDRPEPAGAILERVVHVLQSHRVVDFAFTGGAAVGVWAAPRQTKDIDLCGSLPVGEVDRLLALRDGIRSGPEELPDFVRFRVGDWNVDLFVSKGPYDEECLRRA